MSELEKFLRSEAKQSEKLEKQWRKKFKGFPCEAAAFRAGMAVALRRVEKYVKTHSITEKTP